MLFWDHLIRFGFALIAISKLRMFGMNQWKDLGLALDQTWYCGEHPPFSWLYPGFAVAFKRLIGIGWRHRWSRGCCCFMCCFYWRCGEACLYF